MLSQHLLEGGYLMHFYWVGETEVTSGMWWKIFFFHDKEHLEVALYLYLEKRERAKTTMMS